MVYTSDKRLYVNADRSKIVSEDSPDAAYLLVAEGGELPDDEAAKYKLGQQEKSAKAEHAPAENKAEPAPKSGSGLTVNRAEKK